MLVSLNENHASLSTLEQVIQTVKLLVSANTGSFGFSDWGDGQWTKRAECWDANRFYDVMPASIDLPYKVGKSIAKVYDVTNPANSVLYNIFLVNTRTLTVPISLIGKPVYIELNTVKNARN